MLAKTAARKGIWKLAICDCWGGGGHGNGPKRKSGEKKHTVHLQNRMRIFCFLIYIFYLFFVCTKLNLRIAESWLLLLIGSIVWVPKSPIIVVPATSREKGWKGRWWVTELRWCKRNVCCLYKGFGICHYHHHYQHTNRNGHSHESWEQVL